MKKSFIALLLFSGVLRAFNRETFKKMTFNLKLNTLLALSFLANLQFSSASLAEFEVPERVKLADGQVIHVDYGHLNPLYEDFDNDGVKDLLVGHILGGGQLRIYHNYGTNTKQVFKDYKFLEVDGKPATAGCG
jgi:hypothetical protein